MTSTCRRYASDIRNLISKMTAVTNHHLTPEISLYLITPSCKLWKARPEDCPFVDPFWAFYWAGGQALSRYILDNSSRFLGSAVIDIGSGSGACAIAAAIAGAKTVLANDIDTVACEAIKMNAALNNVEIKVSHEDFIQSCVMPKSDYVLIGDMFYDPEFSLKLMNWLEYYRKQKAVILIGDPGRHTMKEMKKKCTMNKIAEYTLLDHTNLENNGFKSASIWTPIFRNKNEQIN